MDATPNGGFPTTIFSPNAINLAYYWDAKGNMTCRWDDFGNSENVEYDTLNRLQHYHTFNQGNASWNTINYHPTTGNIETKSDLGNITMGYGNNGQKPHALTSLISPLGLPDLMINNQSITYTDFKKVKMISENGKSLIIDYGTDEQRIKSVFTKPGTAALTRYYMGDYEEEIQNGNVRKIHYICGGNGLAAVLVNNTLYYAHTDFQGSLIALSLPDGTVAERYAYDPWGNRRNPTNWTQRDTRTAFILNRGYTMHEHLDEFNLINMNGRVYDPLTAQFFSPDPYVQAPDNWLNYNRYGYCMNNPFLYTDPSGEFWWLIGGFIGGLINWGAHGFELSWNGLAAFGIGFAGGTLATLTGGAALASFGTGVGAGGFIGGAVSGGVAYTSSTMVTSAGNNIAFGDDLPTADGFIKGFAFSMVTGGLINGTAAAMNGRNFMTGKFTPKWTMPNLPGVTPLDIKEPSLDEIANNLKNASKRFAK